MAGSLQKYLDHAAKKSGSASNRAVYVVEETAVNSFESPAAADLIVTSGDTLPQQAPELVSINARQPGSRAPQAQIQGPTDHGEAPIKFPWRPPTAAGGSDVPMGHKALTAFFGTASTVNGQAAKAIGSVVSHSPTATVVRVTAAITDYSLGQIVAHRIGAAAGTPGARGNGFQAQITKLDDTPGGGSIDITLVPGFLVRPSTADYIRGLTTYMMDEAWEKRWSMLVLDGYDSHGLIGGVFNSLRLAFSRREVLELELGYQFRNRWKASEDQVRGDASTDAFTASDTVLRPGDVKRYLIPYTGGYPKVILRKMVVATGLQSGSDEVVEIISADTSAGTITLATRAGTGVAATDLTIATSTQEVEGPYLIDATHKNLDLNLDNRGWITIALTEGAARTATQIATDIHAALAASSLYGHYIDAHTGIDIDWGASVASSVTTAKVRLTSKLWGSQSRIQVRASASNDAGVTTAGSKIFSAAFDISATDEVQILPWTPGGTESRTAIHGREGISRINGYVLETTECNVSNDQQAEWMEDVRHLDPIGPAGVLPGVERNPEISVTVDARGWTGRLEKMADASELASFCFQGGGDALASGIGIFCKAARFTSPTPSGDGARRYKAITVRPQSWIGQTVISAVTTDYVMPEMAAANA